MENNKLSFLQILAFNFILLNPIYHFFVPSPYSKQEIILARPSESVEKTFEFSKDNNRIINKQGLVYLANSSGKIISDSYDSLTPLGERYFSAKKGLDETIIDCCGGKVD